MFGPDKIIEIHTHISKEEEIELQNLIAKFLYTSIEKINIFDSSDYLSSSEFANSAINDLNIEKAQEMEYDRI